MNDELPTETPGIRPHASIAATEAELDAAEAIVAEIEAAGCADFAALHEVRDANEVLHAQMATQGLDAVGDLPAANRVTATADLILSPDLATCDDEGDPLRCGDCGRRMAYDYEREMYIHLVDPGRGCFLIGPDSQPAPDTHVHSDTVSARLDRLERPTADPSSTEPPPTSRLEL